MAVEKSVEEMSEDLRAKFPWFGCGTVPFNGWRVWSFQGYGAVEIGMGSDKDAAILDAWTKHCQPSAQQETSKVDLTSDEAAVRAAVPDASMNEEDGLYWVTGGLLLGLSSRTSDGAWYEARHYAAEVIAWERNYRTSLAPSAASEPAKLPCGHPASALVGDETMHCGLCEPAPKQEGLAVSETVDEAVQVEGSTEPKEEVPQYMCPNCGGLDGLHTRRDCITNFPSLAPGEEPRPRPEAPSWMSPEAQGYWNAGYDAAVNFLAAQSVSHD